MKTTGLGVLGSDKKFQTLVFDRKEVEDNEILIEVSHCGVCHSDLHQARNDWENTKYPSVPGHEVVGQVTQVGSKVTKFKVGDRAGIGCMINSCQNCEKCNEGLEQFCEHEKGCTMTYNGYKNGQEGNSYGGYSNQIVVNENFGLTIPDSLDSEYVGPIMCAGITVYSPMRHWNLQKGQTLGVAGVGGLGHMAIKIGKALGANVVAFTRNAEKMEQIVEMGADYVIDSTNEEQMEGAMQSLNMLIDTIPVKHDINPYIRLMKADSSLVVVGNMMGFDDVDSGSLVFNRVTLAGSLIGGIKETQEIIDLCAKNNIHPTVKTVSTDQIDEVFDSLKEGTSGHFRHVLDMSTLSSTDQANVKEVETPTRGTY